MESKFKFKFMPINNVPLAKSSAAFVVEDSTAGTSIVLNGSDADSKYTSFIITELPTKGSLFQATGEPIANAYSSFQVSDEHRR